MPNAAPWRTRRPWREWLPRGGALDPEVWEHRHRFVVGVLWLHVPALFLFGCLRGVPPTHALAEVLPIALCAVAGSLPRLGRVLRSSAACLGLFVSSAVLVHLWDGVIEAHFHFFVMVGLITLYQDWLPFLVGIGFTLVEHGVIGVLAPTSVYDHEAAQRQPWVWAGVHAAFLLASALAYMASWRLSEDAALRDPLTGLDNRALLLRRLDRAVARARRHGTPLTVLLVDLDGFKAVNDRRGHATGDRLLVEVARRMRGAVRERDVVARLGGDEFAIMLDGADTTVGQAIGNRLVRELAEPVLVDGADARVGASIGVAALGPAASSSDDLLRNADLAMYAAKAGGRGALVCFEHRMGEDARSRSELEAELARAVGRGELVVHYQPTVALDTGRPVGVEALVRWQHPRLGLLLPAEFIGVAEQSDVICDLGRHVLGEATRQARAWQDELGLRRFRVAVNVSARHLASDRFVDDVREALDRSGLDPSTLVLEITESLLIEDVSGSAGKLAALRRLGTRIAVDDFGTGFSSLSYLRHLPVDILKIDRSFVSGLDPGAPTESLAQAIVHIGETLDLQVVAEGVEREEEHAALRRLRCQQAQGFLFAKALPADEVRVLLAAAAGPSLGAVPTPAPASAPALAAAG